MPIDTNTTLTEVLQKTFTQTQSPEQIGGVTFDIPGHKTLSVPTPIRHLHRAVVSIRKKHTKLHKDFAESLTMSSEEKRKFEQRLSLMEENHSFCNEIRQKLLHEAFPQMLHRDFVSSILLTNWKVVFLFEGLDKAVMAEYGAVFEKFPDTALVRTNHER